MQPRGDNTLSTTIHGPPSACAVLIDCFFSVPRCTLEGGKGTHTSTDRRTRRTEGREAHTPPRSLCQEVERAVGETPKVSVSVWENISGSGMTCGLTASPPRKQCLSPCSNHISVASPALMVDLGKFERIGIIGRQGSCLWLHPPLW